MTELYSQNIIAALAGEPYDLDLLMEADLALSRGSQVLLPASERLGDVRQFQLLVAQMVDHPGVAVRTAANKTRCGTFPPPPEQTQAVVMPENVSRELGTPQATRTETSGFNADLPQCMEFLRPTISLLMQAGCSDPIIQLLLKSALEAKDLGVLGDWSKLIVDGVTKTLQKHSERPPDEFVPAMIKFVEAKLNARFSNLDNDIQKVIQQIGARVPEAHKGRFLDYVEAAIQEDKAKYFVSAYEELLATEQSGRSIMAPWRFWSSVIDHKVSQEKTDKLRQPIKVAIKDAVEWIKPWLPAYDPAKLVKSNIEEFQPLAKRTSRERQIEAAYFKLREEVIKKEHGAALDAIVDAWTSPESADLASVWVNVMEKAYTDDGKRFAFSAQHFGIIATAFFLEIFRKKECEAWVEMHRDELLTHPRIGELYAQVFPTQKKES